jgi:hypothetical protein
MGPVLKGEDGKGEDGGGALARRPRARPG